MSTRAPILEAAAGLLSKSVDGDVSTRAVCEAARVGAASMIMAGNTGAVLALICRTELYFDPALAEHVRDAVFAAVLTEESSITSAPTPLSDAASTLKARLTTRPPAELTDRETGLLHEWLDRITAA